MSSKDEGKENVVDSVARFLSFFREARIYSPIDKMARPFSYEDCVSALNEALRQAVVAKENAVEKVDAEGRRRRYVKVRDREIPEPFIPSRQVLEEFLNECKRDLTKCREAALLALAYGG